VDFVNMVVILQVTLNAGNLMSSGRISF